MIESHEERVFDAIRRGTTRRAQLVRVTCLGDEEVKSILSRLRKQRKVVIEDSEYRVTNDQA